MHRVGQPVASLAETCTQCFSDITHAGLRPRLVDPTSQQRKRLPPTTSPLASCQNSHDKLRSPPRRNTILDHLHHCQSHTVSSRPSASQIGTGARLSHSTLCVLPTHFVAESLMSASVVAEAATTRSLAPTACVPIRSKSTASRSCCTCQTETEKERHRGAKVGTGGGG